MSDLEKNLNSIELHNDQIEEAIRVLEKNNNEANIYKLIRLLQEEGAEGGMFFVPVIDADDCEIPPENLFDVDKLSIDNVFETEKEKEKQAVPRRVELFKGGYAFTAFTSREELEKGEGTKYTSMPILSFLEMAFEDDTCVGVVLNPWDVSILLDKRVLNLILNDQPKPKVQSSVYIDKGDITKLDVDAIVNAANTSLRAGGGVCGAIFAAAGEGLVHACNQIGTCPVGQARITRGYNLPARYIIHTPGPVYSGNEEDDILLENSYYNSLELARKNGLHSIAFPAISTGIYGYPLEKAVPIAVITVSRWINEHPGYEMEVILICYDDETYQAYSNYVQGQ